MIRKLLRWCIVGFCFGLGGAQGAAILEVDPSSGLLTGAWGVLVHGVAYDVRFVEGSCDSLFDSCDSSTSFAFQNEADALAASQALLDSVFVDSPGEGLFDSHPELTAGCTFESFCWVFTPYEISSDCCEADGSLTPRVLVVRTQNGVPDPNQDWDWLQPTAYSRDFDTGSESGVGATYAVWRKSVVAAVPEPATLVFCIAGSVLVVLSRGRRVFPGTIATIRRRQSP